MIESIALLALVSSLGLAHEVSSSPQMTPDPFLARPHQGAITDAPEVLLGDRLFRETRFSQFFFAHSKGDVNAKLTAPDSVSQNEVTTTGTIPYGKTSISCRQCHLGDDFLQTRHFSGRTYCDFARRSPVPARNDGITTTVRNAPLMVDLFEGPDAGRLFHLDGEFASIQDLVVSTITGREFGWLPNEERTAKAHIARVIRGDDGNNELANRFKPAERYRVLMLGTDPSIPGYLRIPPRYRIDVEKASDDQILRSVASLMLAYMKSLHFETDRTGQHIGSPYDLFLGKNGLPRRPAHGESDLQYARRLREMVGSLGHPRWVTRADGWFWTQDQQFQFGPQELEGLKIFLAEPGPEHSNHVGNCVACHTPPEFTDRKFHNDGATQFEYDAIFGSGAFAKLKIPSLRERNEAADEDSPPSEAHPLARARFRSAPLKASPGYCDLGVWNIVGNPDFPAPQPALKSILCGEFQLSGSRCNADVLLPLTIAYFKTPSLRDLGQSNPYLHSGALDSLDEVIEFYVASSESARHQWLRNASPELRRVSIDDDDVAPLAAFLKSLDENYH